MALAELRPGLWRWTARHPDWRPAAEPGSPADWPEAVGCVAARVEGGLVFIDPLVPAGDARFWAAADALVEGTERVAVLTTIAFHRRSRDAVAARYRASTSRSRSQLPAGVEPLPVRGAGETMFWLPEHRALVPGDRLVGGARGELRLCPDSGLRYLPSGITRAELRERLRPLLELPVEAVLVSHGEPVLERAGDALAAALAGS